MLALLAVLIFFIVNSLLKIFYALFEREISSYTWIVCLSCFLVSTKMPSKMPIAEFCADRLPSFMPIDCRVLCRVKMPIAEFYADRLPSFMPSKNADCRVMPRKNADC